ncbi:hypothetical protein [Trueperella sp. LYQ141]|uniref:hypothetical protein n=1 Tax=Trueperella sp. LYQ141 TaxID=3391058 RepID=UPI003982DD8A
MTWQTGNGGKQAVLNRETLCASYRLPLVTVKAKTVPLTLNDELFAKRSYLPAGKNGWLCNVMHNHLLCGNLPMLARIIHPANTQMKGW